MTTQCICDRQYPLVWFDRYSYSLHMSDLKLHIPSTEEVEVDRETLEAIDRGIKEANEGRTVSLDEVRKMIPEWISKFISQKRR